MMESTRPRTSRRCIQLAGSSPWWKSATRRCCGTERTPSEPFQEWKRPLNRVGSHEPLQTAWTMRREGVSAEWDAEIVLEMGGTMWSDRTIS
jgi:hypothetical protein